MRIYKKILLTFLIIPLLFVVLVIIFFNLNKNDQQKEMGKFYIRKIENLIYKEATIHNPQGDLLPDDIDNSIISKIKILLNWK